MELTYNEMRKEFKGRKDDTSPEFRQTDALRGRIVSVMQCLHKNTKTDTHGIYDLLGKTPLVNRLITLGQQTEDYRKKSLPYGGDFLTITDEMDERRVHCFWLTSVIDRKNAEGDSIRKWELDWDMAEDFVPVHHIWESYLKLTRT
jgi:hypothetical protein